MQKVARYREGYKPHIGTEVSGFSSCILKIIDNQQARTTVSPWGGLKIIQEQGSCQAGALSPQLCHSTMRNSCVNPSKIL